MTFDIPGDEVFEYLDCLYKDFYRGRIALKEADVEKSQTPGEFIFRLRYRFTEALDEP